MPGKTVTPEKIADAVSLRAAGFTAMAIAERLDISVRTVHRILARHGGTKGALKHELVDAAKKDLIAGVMSNDRIKTEAAKLLADDLAHARKLREQMVLASEHMTATSLKEAVLVMRAAAAYSTALKNVSDMVRHSLRSERALDAEEEKDLPQLVVVEITEDEARKMRQAHLESDESSPALPSPGEPTATPVAATEEENERVSEGDDEPA